MVNDFDRPQPRGQAEMKNVAAEALGQKGGKPHAPRFHRMSITAAENGHSISHTIVKKRKPPKGGVDNTSPGVSDGEDHVSKEAVFGHDHPIAQHIQAIHDHMMKYHDQDQTD